MAEFPKSKSQKFQVGDVCAYGGRSNSITVGQEVIVLFTYWQRYHRAEGTTAGHGKYCVMYRDGRSWAITAWVSEKDMSYLREPTCGEQSAIIRALVECEL